MMNAAARVITHLSVCDHVQPALKLLHWYVENFVQGLPTYALHSHWTGIVIFIWSSASFKFLQLASNAGWDQLT